MMNTILSKILFTTSTNQINGLLYSKCTWHITQGKMTTNKDFTGSKESVFTLCAHHTHIAQSLRKSVVVPWYHCGLTQTCMVLKQTSTVCAWCLHGMNMDSLDRIPYSWMFFPVQFTCISYYNVPRPY